MVLSDLQLGVSLAPHPIFGVSGVSGVGGGGVGEERKCTETGEPAPSKIIIINYYLLNTPSRHGPGGGDRKDCSVPAGEGLGGGGGSGRGHRKV